MWAARWMTTAGLLALVLALQLPAARAARATDAHSRTWNRFVDALYALHLKRTHEHRVRTTTVVGGYPRHPDFYDDVRYYDANTGRLLSRVLWQRNDTDTWGRLKSVLGIRASRDRAHVHSIAVYIYDGQGRVARDYSATYLPDYRGAPTQTLVFLHGYPGNLHALRAFDASGNPTYERCTGTLDGKPVDLAFDEDRIFDLRRGAAEARSPVYRACFDPLPVTAGADLTPR